MNVPKPARYTIAVDLGKVVDYSALAVIEEPCAFAREDIRRGRWIPEWAEDPTFNRASGDHGSLGCYLRQVAPQGTVVE
jgi:hypothetical protein